MGYEGSLGFFVVRGGRYHRGRRGARGASEPELVADLPVPFVDGLLGCVSARRAAAIRTALDDVVALACQAGMAHTLRNLAARRAFDRTELGGFAAAGLHGLSSPIAARASRRSDCASSLSLGVKHAVSFTNSAILRTMSRRRSRSSRKALRSVRAFM